MANIRFIAPLPDEYYYVLISCFDDNGSYNQIGFLANYGAWWVIYDWTTYDSNFNYHFHGGGVPVSTGGCYAFNITTQSGFTNFTACDESSTQILFYTAPTGGNCLHLCWTYQDYEEVWWTHTGEVAPTYDFYFYNQYWVSTNGTTSVSTWLPFESDCPSGVSEEISGDSVLVENPNVTITPQYPPACAMKTRTDGYFYVPNVNGFFHVRNATLGFLKIEELFSNANLTGVQNGGTAYYSGVSYPTIANYPDGKIDITDVSLAARIFGSVEGAGNWNYMADIVPDHHIDIADVSAASRNFGKRGSYIIRSIECYDHIQHNPIDITRR